MGQTAVCHSERAKLVEESHISEIPRQARDDNAGLLLPYYQNERNDNLSLYNKKVREYNNILKVLSGSRKKEHQKEMAEYHNNTQTATSAMQSGRDAEGRTLASYGGGVSNTVGATASLVKGGGPPKAVEGFSTRPATQTYKPQKPKSAFEQWNIEKTQPKLSYGAERLIQTANPSRNRWLDTTLRSYLSKPTNVDKVADRGYNKNAEFKMQNSKLTIPQYPAIGRSGSPAPTTLQPGLGYQNVGAIHESPVYDSAFKKNAENQWYNKIAHGSFKEDDWFNSMVKNQEKAQSWYNNTYGEKVGKKEYQNLHNRLINTPFDKIKEEEKQFINYKASDFKVPELEPVNYSYSGSASKGELNREKTGCYKKGDENLPFLTNYIINGIDGKTGGLNKAWQDADSYEERARIEKVADMLRAEETDYDIGKIDSVMILRAIDGAKFAGHTALIIKNSDGQGVYFSFAEVNNSMIGNGEMSIDVLNKQQMDKFLKDGEMNYICNSTGTIESQKYSSYSEVPISKEQGANMIGKGIGYFHNPGWYALVGKQCDIVVQNILNQGNVDYKSKILPNKSFSDYRDKNELEEKTIKSLEEVVMDKIPSNVRNSIKGWFE